MADTPIGKLLKTITDFLANNKTTLTNLVLTGITVGLNVLLADELFDCPVEKSTTYGYLFLFAPFIILIFANMLVIVVDWDPRKLCSEVLDGENAKAKAGTCCKVTIPSITRVFVAPIVWLIVSFAETDYYVCGKVGAGPDKMKNLTADEIEALEDLIAKTKTESQIIAWALFVGMVCVTFLVICLENLFGGKGKSDERQVAQE
ncbi:hypothetical protein ACROYT_G027618 [Oculina patagonica]